MNLNRPVARSEPTKPLKASTKPQISRPAMKPIGNANRGDGGKVEELRSQMMELKLTVEGLEKERDFYFGKLRDIEVLCQEHDTQNNPFIQKILDVLYATEEGFEPPEEGDVPPPPEEEEEY